MKLKPFILLGLITLTCNIWSQQVIVLQPDATDGKDARISNLFTTNAGNWPEFAIAAWSWGGTPGIIRELIDFDLSSIGENAIVEKAELFLYAAETSSMGPHSTLSGSNSMYIRRVTSPWQENTVTWATQPSTTTVNQVITAASTDPYEDYTINVTNLVQDMVTNPSSSNGFMLKLVTESRYRNVNFASSDHPDASLHPKLVITLAGSVAFQPGAEEGKDARVSNLFTTNAGNWPEFAIAAWSWGGTPGTIRELIEFNTSSIKSGTTIGSAKLKLYAAETSSMGPHSTLSGSNNMYVRRVTSPWEENAVTWATQPSTTTVNQVVTGASTDPYQNYSIDVTELVQDMVNNPSSSHGFMLRLVTESRYRNVNFASSDHPNASLHPKLELYISPSRLKSETDNSEISNLENGETEYSIKAYPNPTNGIISIENTNYKNEEKYFIQISNMSSKVVFKSEINSGLFDIDLNQFGSPGMYIIQYYNESGDIMDVNKILLQ